jgi:probable F420-dependent oxidoreductase
MPQPFRFGIQIHDLPVADWRERVRSFEALGYSTIFLPDHFSDQWEPAAALGAFAGVSETLNVGTLVYDVDYRHPVILAKSSATLHALSGGRHEFGIGAGWMEADYREAGMTYDSAGVRISRLDEALQVIRSMWSQERTSFAGEYYQIDNIAQAAPMPDASTPKILIGGGGPRILRLAGRYADIVGINPALPEGRVTKDTPKDSSPERVLQKIGWVREGAEAAGRDASAIEFNSLTFVVAISDDPKPLREGLAQNTGMTVEQVADCPLFLTGSASELRDRLETRREQTGISYIVIQGADPAVLESFAEAIVEPLAGR